MRALVIFGQAMLTTEACATLAAAKVAERQLLLTVTGETTALLISCSNITVFKT